MFSKPEVTEHGLICPAAALILTLKAQTRLFGSRHRMDMIRKEEEI
jgi:hypothetical protein